MGVLVDRQSRVLVQGITGREGTARTRLMLDYGTRVVAGCTPGRGGGEVQGVPVFDTVAEARDAVGGIDTSVIYVPARLVKGAAIEALDAGIGLVVLVGDRVPLWDVYEVARAARANGANFLGPNTLGCLVPGEAVLGMIGGRAESARSWFKQGPAGIASRSGGMTSSTAYYLAKAGIGASALVHVGGDPVIGLPLPDVALRFQEDPTTRVIVLFGEIGGSQEERVAAHLVAGRINKPVVAYVGGKSAKEGTRFSHAGAIVEGSTGTHAGKVEALRAAGAVVVDHFEELPAAVSGVLDALSGAG
jgi:succinyl-CoA synthetase alpha subunit